jgi:hypothetical protein
MPNIRPIPTLYAGYRFRSRVEARWAVFFNTLGIQWEYEYQGYNLGDAGLYLPDFWLPMQNYWFECKPTQPSDSEVEKCARLASGTQAHAFIAAGSPSLRWADASGAIPGVNRVQVGNICWLRPERRDLSKRFYCHLQWVHSPELGFRIGTAIGHCIDVVCHGIDDTGSCDPYHPQIMAAYTAARSARFEHGERPSGCS